MLPEFDLLVLLPQGSLMGLVPRLLCILESSMALMNQVVLVEFDVLLMFFFSFSVTLNLVLRYGKYAVTSLIWHIRFLTGMHETQ